MYENPALFPAISNRESWIQTVQIFDDDTGDLIALADGSGNCLYTVSLEIRPPCRSGYYGYPSSPYYDAGSSESIIFTTLSQGSPALNPGGYLIVPDNGTVSINIPKSVIQTLSVSETYDVFLTISDDANDDARQILIGKLPVLFGGSAT